MDIIDKTRTTLTLYLMKIEPKIWDCINKLKTIYGGKNAQEPGKKDNYN